MTAERADMAEFKEERKKRYAEGDKNAVIGEKEVLDAFERLKEYQNSKAFIDNKATSNQEWWRLRHWSQMQKKDQSKADDEKPTSAWLFNSIINKHADIMDNFPKPNVLPREREDEAEAKQLSNIIPVMLERNNYEDVYSAKNYDYIIDGGCITGVFWDKDASDGMGDIRIEQIDVHNIFWEPGIEDIQDSKEVFVIAAIENEELVKMYPQMEGKGGNNFTKVEYMQDDYVDKSDRSYVVDWYYKTREYVPVMEDPETGEQILRPKTVLHYCKFCNGVVLYSTENAGLEDGLYEHGKYPFVVQTLFPIKDSLWGFGYVDVMRNPQMYVDALDQIITKNAFMVGSPRFWIRENSGINTDEFADWSKPFVSFSGGSIDDVIKKVEVDNIPAFVVQHKTNKIDELKETSGNRDFSQGSTQSGVTAASAIAALQEAGSKLSRDMIRGCYRAFQEENYLVVELIRQFYSEPRSFRIDQPNGQYGFVEYSNAGMQAKEIQPDGSTKSKKAIFDIQIVAEKQSPFSRAAQNETAKELYGVGLFNPQMAEAALICLDMMEFEGKETIKQQVQQNSIMMQQMNAMAQAIMQYDAMFPQLGIAAAAGLAQQNVAEGAATAPEGGAKKEPGTAEERAAKSDTDTTSTVKARTKAARQATPNA